MVQFNFVRSGLARRERKLLLLLFAGVGGVVPRATIDLLVYCVSLLVLAAVLAEPNSSTQQKRYAEWHIQPCDCACLPATMLPGSVTQSASVPGTPPTTEGGLSVGAESKQGRGRERERERERHQRKRESKWQSRITGCITSPRIPLALRMAERESERVPSQGKCNVRSGRE